MEITITAYNRFDEKIKHKILEGTDGQFYLRPVGVSSSPVGLISRYVRQLLPTTFLMDIQGNNASMIIYYQATESEHFAGNYDVSIGCDNANIYSVSGISLINKSFVRLVQTVATKFWEFETYSLFNSVGDFLVGNYAKFMPIGKYKTPSYWLDKVGEYDLERGMSTLVMYKVLKRESKAIEHFVQSQI